MRIRFAYALLAMGLTALATLAVQSRALAGAVPGRGSFGGSSAYVCKSGHQVQQKKACKEFGGKY